MTTLFRREALDAQRDSLLGGIRIGRRLDFTLIAALALLLSAALLSFFIYGHVTRKARITGVLMPALGALPVVSGSAGLITELPVSEGLLVRRGATLAVIDLDRSAGQGDTVELLLQHIQRRAEGLASERSSRIALNRQRQAALVSRIDSAKQQVQRAEQDAELARQRLLLAQKSVGRYEQLANAGFMSGMQSQQKQDELLEFQARVNMADRTLSDLLVQQRLLIDEQQQAQLQLRTELGDVDRAIAALEQERVETAARRRLVLTAPRSGRVSALNVKLGQTVGNGQTLALLLPTNDGGGLSLQAELYAPSRTSGFVRPGQTVWIRLAAFPYQKFGMAQGEVVEVSNAPIAPQDLPPGQSGEPLYRIRARLQRQTMDAYGQSYPLKAGMTLEADVVQDRRSVGELVFEPLFAARARQGTL